MITFAKIATSTMKTGITKLFTQFTFFMSISLAQLDEFTILETNTTTDLNFNTPSEESLLLYFKH